MKNILLKLSGEALGIDGVSIFDVPTFDAFAAAIKDGLTCRDFIYVVCGGGNVCRGREFTMYSDSEKIFADYAGMLASIQNALHLRVALEKHGIPTQIVSPDNFTIPYTVSESDISADTRVVIYAGGVGMPGHSTDYVCAVKAKEHNCDIYFAKNGCDGVYDRDPNGKDGRNAVYYPEITYGGLVSEGLKVIDEEAAELLAGSDTESFVFALTADNVRAMLCNTAVGMKMSVIR